MFELKCGRRIFNVDSSDKIIFNGATYILITQRYFDGWFRVNPHVAKGTFNKLLKAGKIRKSNKKYITSYGGVMDLYEFVEEE